MGIFDPSPQRHTLLLFVHPHLPAFTLLKRDKRWND